jgi:hypothetical protein
MGAMLNVWNTWKASELKDPFQRAKVTVLLVWSALAAFLGCHLLAANQALEIPF